MPHPLFLFEARRASKGSVSPAGSVGAPATPGRPQDDRALSWTLSLIFPDSPSGFERFGLRFDGQVQKLS